MRLTKALVVLLAVLTIFGCRKDIDGVSTEEIIKPSIPYLQETDLVGQVVDENGNPIENASIQFTSFTETSDENGYFKFNSIDINEDGFLTTFEKDGFFNGYKFVFPSNSNSSFIKVMMVEKKVPSYFDANSGGTISTNGASLSFKENSIVLDNTEQFYNGEIQAYFHWYNPSSVNTAMSMPGDLRGISKDNQFVALASYGMIAVELYGSNGEKLNLAPNTTASLNMQAPEGNNPGVMPTWSMDEVSGYWKEESEATLIDGNYVAELSHFSFWNCDVPFDLVFINGFVQTPDNYPLSNALIKISTLGSITRSGYTNNAGEFSGFVPKDQPLEISIYDECGNLSYSAPLGEFSEDTTIPPIFANLSSESINISGRVLCNGAPVTAGYVKINYGEENLTLIDIDNDGSFETSRMLCAFDASSVSLYAINTELGTTSDEITIDSIGPNSINVGSIDACNQQAEEWFSYSINGEAKETLYEVESSYGVPGLIINAGTGQFTAPIHIRIFEAEIGDNNPVITSFNDVWDESISCSGLNECTTMNFNFTTFDRFTGGFIEGTYSGTLETEQIPVEGDFRIRIKEYKPIAKVSGRMWEDVNQNGLYDPDEPPIENDRLFANSGGGYQLITEPSGEFYGWVNADESFYLEYSIGNGEFITLQDVGNNDSIDNDFNSDGQTETFQLSEGEEINDFGLGIVKFETLSCSTIPQDGYVFSCDFNTTPLTINVDNGTGNYSYEWSTGETSQSIIATNQGTYTVTVTDANGTSCEAEFIVIPNPSVEVDFEINYPKCGNSDGSIQIINQFEFQTVYWFELNLDAYELSDLAPGIYSYEAQDSEGCYTYGSITLEDQSTVIGNQVFIDAPGGSPNIFDAGDGALPGVIVNLLEAQTLEVLDTQTTDQLGNYLFTGEYEGTFIIEFVIPDGFVFIENLNGPEDEQNNDAIPDDINPQIGRTLEFEVECGDIILYIDAGVKT